MGLLYCQINFTMLDPRGWVVGHNIPAHLDPSYPLDGQTTAEVLEWVARRNRTHGTGLTLSYVLSVFIEKEGFWHAVERKTSACVLEWPKNL